jgi:hypothetical protein
MSEVWAKVLFLEGVAGIGRTASRRSLAALWVTASGDVHTSRALDQHVVWRRP